MPRKKYKKVTRDIVKTVRLNASEYIFLKHFCESENYKLTTFLRSCAVDYADRILKDQAVMGVEPEDRRVTKEVFQDCFEDFKAGFTKNFEDIDGRLLKLEKFLEGFIFMFYMYNEAIPKDQYSERWADANKRYGNFVKYVINKMAEGDKKLEEYQGKKDPEENKSGEVKEYDPEKEYEKDSEQG